MCGVYGVCVYVVCMACGSLCVCVSLCVRETFVFRQTIYIHEIKC